MYYNRGKYVISARIIFVRDAKFLLCMRRRKEKNAYANHKWILPGGTTDKHETAMECGIREAEEEVGIIVDKSDLDFIGVVHWYAEDRDVDGVALNWACAKWSYEVEDTKEPQNKEEDRCEKLGWFDAQEVELLNQAGLLESTSYDILRAYINGKKGVYIESSWPANFENHAGNHIKYN